MKAFIGFLVVLILAGGGYWFYTNNMQSAQTAQNDQVATTTPPVIEKGNVVVGVTNSATSSSAISAVTVDVMSVELFSDAKGWVQLPAQEAEYNLVDLKSKSQTKAFTVGQVDAGPYSKMRITFDDAMVTPKGKTAKSAAAPGTAIEVGGAFTVNANQVTAIVVDMQAGKSVHTNSKGEYVFTPVVRIVSTTNAQGQVSAEGLVEVSGGTTNVDATVGMDVDGSVKTNFEITSAKVDLKVATSSTEATTTTSASPTGALKTINGTSTPGANGVVNQ